MPKNTLKIAFVYDDSLDGSEGVAQQTKLIGGWMSSRGHEVSYFVGQTKLDKWQQGKVYSLATNQQVVFNGNRVSIPWPARSKVIAKALAQAKPDVLHVQMPHSPFMAGRVINASALPAIGTFHIFPANLLVKVGARLLRLMYLGGLNRISPIVSVSSAAQTFARSAFGLKTDIIPNTVSLKNLKSTIKAKPNTIVFLGRLVERKGCAQLIEAVARVKLVVPDIKLIIGGQGPLRGSLEKLVSKLDLTDNVEFKGFIEEADKADFLAQATVACFPSLYGESFGIVLAEAMAAGAEVVIGGDNPGYASVLAPQPDLLVDPNDSQKFAKLLVSFLTDAEKRASVNAWQKTYVVQFDIETVGPSYEKLYNQAIAKKQPPRHN